MTELTPEPMTPEPIGHEPIIQEPMAQSERMLLEAVAALEQADANLRDPGIEPYRLADWSECLDAQKTNENSILPCPLPPDLLANTQASDAHRSADTDLAGSSSLRTDAAVLKPRNFVSNSGELSLRSGLFTNSQKTLCSFSTPMQSSCSIFTRAIADWPKVKYYAWTDRYVSASSNCSARPARHHDSQATTSILSQDRPGDIFQPNRRDGCLFHRARTEYPGDWVFSSPIAGPGF